MNKEKQDTVNTVRKIASKILIAGSVITLSVSTATGAYDLLHGNQQEMQKDYPYLYTASQEEITSAKNEIADIEQRVDNALSNGKPLPVLSDEETQSIVEDKSLLDELSVRKYLEERLDKKTTTRTANCWVFGGTLSALGLIGLTMNRKK